MTNNVLALIIGEVSAWLIIVIAGNLAGENPGILFITPYLKYLPLVFPIFCLIFLRIARWIGKTIPVVYQLAKFILVGGLNFLIDMGVLNFLIFATGISAGITQSGFKSLSFLVAVINSYIWNRYWTFKREIKKSVLQEFFQFFTISVVVFLINVGIDYIFVNEVRPFWEITLKTWAQFSAMMAVAIATVCNFLGYKFIVFNTKK